MMKEIAWVHNIPYEFKDEFIEFIRKGIDILRDQKKATIKYPYWDPLGKYWIVEGDPDTITEKEFITFMQQGATKMNAVIEERTGKPGLVFFAGRLERHWQTAVPKRNVEYYKNRRHPSWMPVGV